ncbi:MAG: carboxypeptidase regulatory-like domain-containing protein, partial [Acidobacteriota bacterium]
MKVFAYSSILALLAAVGALAQTSAETGRIVGLVKDPTGAVIADAKIGLTNRQTKVKRTAVTDGQGVYKSEPLPPGQYVAELELKGFKTSASPELKVVAGKTVDFNFTLVLAGASETVTVSGAVENAYRVDNVDPSGPLGTTPILDLPYSVNVISRQLIDDTQSRNFKEAAKYLP